MGDTSPTAPEPTSAAILSEARAIAESITGKNWREKKAALLALVG
jgi:hypothetical protein